MYIFFVNKYRTIFHNQYTEVRDGTLIQLFMCFFPYFLSSFCSIHDSDLDLISDLNFVWQSIR